MLGLDADARLKDRAELGQLLETFVSQELRRLARWRDDQIRFHHFRDEDGCEVDIALERGAGKGFAAGVVLYDGETSVGFGDGLWAIPIRALWEGM